MIHHPVILIPKIVVLLIITIVLTILHGILPPEQFRVAVVVAAISFVCFVIALWVIVLRALRNPDSKLAKGTILSHAARSADGFRAGTDEFSSLVGVQGIALSALRPSGDVLIRGKKIPVLTAGRFVEPKTPVVVVEVDGNKVIVQPTAGLLGVQGVSLSRLEPSGDALLDGRQIPVVTNGPLVEANTPVVVVQLKADKVVVEQAKNPTASVEPS